MHIYIYIYIYNVPTCKIDHNAPKQMFCWLVQVATILTAQLACAVLSMLAKAEVFPFMHKDR